MAITILDLAKFRGVKESEDGSITMGAMEEVDLPFMGGCGMCGACIAAYNASPSKSGYLKCTNGCIGDDGWDSVEQADRDLKAMAEEYEAAEECPDSEYCHCGDEDEPQRLDERAHYRSEE